MTIAVPSLRAVVCAPGWVRNDLWRRARAVPSLDLRFADSKSLVDAVTGQNLITFTRSSSGTYIDSQGVLRTAATNEPRFDHDPVTGESLGLLVEEQRTNSIRNNTMQGAVAGTPGTLPTNWTDNYPGSPINGIERRVVDTGQENGITYLDYRLFGTTTAGTAWNLFTESVGSITAASGQFWTSSFYCRRVAGSDTGITNFNNIVIEYSGAGVLLDLSSASFLTTGTTLASSRFSVTRAFNNASTASASQLIQFIIANGATIDITLRIVMPQLEQGAFATSVIPTTGISAATRNADVADIINAAIAAGIRTLYAEFRSPASDTRGVVSLNDNTANERAAINTSGTDPRLVIVDGGVTQADIDAGTIAANVRSRMAVRIAADNFAASFNGGAVVTDTSGTLPTVDRLFIGRTQAGEYLNAPIARLVGWREELPDSALQALTQ